MKSINSDPDEISPKSVNSGLSLIVRLFVALVAAVIIGIFSGYFGGSLLSVEQQFESSIRSNGSLIGDIIHREPALFSAFLEAYQMERSGKKVEADNRRAEILQSLVIANFKQSHDAPVVSYAQMYLDYVETVNSRSSMDCFYSVFTKDGDSENSMISVVREAGLLPELNDVQAAIVSSAFKAPQAVPDAKLAQPLVSKIAVSIDVEHQRFFVRLNANALRKQDQENACNAQIAFYRNIMSLPRAEASMVLRYLLF
jgi:hypothetical protein